MTDVDGRHPVPQSQTHQEPAQGIRLVGWPAR